MFEALTVKNYLSSKFSARGNLVLCVIAEIFMYSQQGEDIQHESKMIADQIYNSMWYNLRFSTTDKKTLKKFKTLVLLTTMRANRPVKISAGGFTTMSYQTFMGVSLTLRLVKF